MLGINPGQGTIWDGAAWQPADMLSTGGYDARYVRKDVSTTETMQGSLHVVHDLVVDGVITGASGSYTPGDAGSYKGVSTPSATQFSWLASFTSDPQTQLLGKLTAGFDLADLHSVSAARTNLGLGSAALHPAFDFEPAITGGTTAQYWRGDKTWATLNTTAVVEGTNLYYTDARARASLSVGAPLTYNSGTGLFGIRVATSFQDGYLTSADWSVFSNKEPAIAAGTASQYWRGDKTWATLDASAVGLGNVTNEAQTKAAVVPNTLPSAGQILVGNAGGTAYAPQTMGGDGTLSSAGAITVTKTNGVAFAPSATVDTTNASNISSGTLALARGGTGANLSATGGASQVLRQSSAGAAVTVGQLSAGDLTNGMSGSGAVALVNSPTFVSPTLGAALATSINKVAFTQPATGATLTIADGKTFTASNSITVAGVDGKSLTVNNNLTLSGTDGKLLALTGSLTVSADTTISGGGTLALQGFTGTLPATGTVALGAGQLGVSSINDANIANHTHAITSTSNPGAAQVLLSSDASGYLQLVRLGLGLAPTHPLTVGGDAFISASVANLYLKDTSTGWQSASTTVVTPQPGNAVRSTTFTSGLVGWNLAAAGDVEVNNLTARGAIRSSVLLYNALMATAGSFGVFPSAAKLRADVVVPNAPIYGTTTVTIDVVDQDGLSHAASQLFAVNDILWIKDGPVGSTYFKVSAVSDQTSFWRYTAIIMAGTNNVTYYAGGGVASYGASGRGHIISTADAANAPYVQMATHTATFTSQNAAGTLVLTPRFRAGNLNGGWGYNSDTYGFAAGEYASGASWMTVDPTNGLRLGNDTHVRVQIAADGSAFFGTNIAISAAGVLTVGGWTINSTTITSTGVTMASGSSAYLAFGTSPPTGPTSGTGIFQDKTGFYGLSAGVAQVKVDAANGALVAGNGAVTIDYSGVNIAQGTSSANAISWKNGASTMGQIFASSPTHCDLTIKGIGNSLQTGRVIINASQTGGFNGSASTTLTLWGDVSNGDGYMTLDFSVPVGAVKGFSVGKSTSPGAMLDVNGAVLISSTLGISDAATITKNGIGSTSTDGLLLQNTTAAAAGAQQWGPRIHHSARGWKTNAAAASQSVDFIEDLVPVQGAANPTGTLSFKSSVNGAAYVERASLTTAGLFTATSFSGDGAALTNLNGSNVATGTVAAARLAAMVASGASHAPGIVPDPPSTSGTVKFLREDATWAVPFADVQNFTATGTWNKPTGKTWTRVILIAPGGGGGGSANDTIGAGGGGPGGMSIHDFPTAVLGATETITVGAQGAAGSLGNAAGSAGSGGTGGDISFGSWLKATGGGGGLRSGLGTAGAGGFGTIHGIGVQSPSAGAGGNAANGAAATSGANLLPKGGGGGCGNAGSGGLGGSTNTVRTINGGAGGVAGTNPAAGGAGASAGTNEPTGGAGGGGGGNWAGNGGNGGGAGGAGGDFGGGGGGAGIAQAGYNGAGGGIGGRGIAIIISW